jgi:hypothetical protein
VLSIKNVCLVYDMAALYGLSKLMQSCCYFMDRHAGDVIQHESFSNLSRDSLRAIISRFVKFGFSEKATKFEKNLRRTLDKSVVFCARNSELVKKSTKIFQNKCGQVV